MPSSTTFTWEDKSRTTQCGDIGDTHSVTVVRHIYRIDGTTLDVLEAPKLMEDEGAIPRRGDLAYPGSNPNVTWQQYLRYRGYRIEQLPNKAGAQMTHTWDTMYTMVVRPGPTAYFHLPAYIEATSSSRSTKVFRTAWTTNPPAALDATTADIGGTTVQGLGDGMAWPVNQTRIRLRFTQDATAASMISQMTRLASYNNTTNSATFLNCAANTLICEGVSANWVRNEFYEVVFDFLYDEWYHHEQVPAISADGRVRRTAAGAVFDVRWKRLPRTSTDFNNIYGGDTNLKAIVEAGYEP
jgi:hypothetical protein